ncbi:MAG: FAD binding domain-containing protein, partial [Chloroflexota bacterium]
CAELSAQFTERCAATIGGTLASAPSWHDLLPALLLTDAWVLIRSAESQSLVPLDVLLGNRRAYLTPGSLITEITVSPPPADARCAYQRVSRTPRDRATVSVAVRSGRDARVAVGGASQIAMRARATEQVLSGRPLTDELSAQAAMQLQAECDPPSDHIASAEYRRAMLGVLLRRALNEVAHA